MPNRLCTLKSACLFIFCCHFAGFSDPYSPYGNTRAFLDYSVMGFRECAAEISHYISSIEGADKEPLKMRLAGHLDNLLSQKELAINAAMAANTQVAIPKITPPPLSVMSMTSGPAMSIPYAPLTPPRASPDNLSPPAGFAETLPRFSVAFPIPNTPIISLAPAATLPTVFHSAPAGFKPPVISRGLQCPRPLTVITSTATSVAYNVPSSLNSPVSPPLNKNATLEMTASAVMLPKSPTKTPFRPWADAIDTTNNA